MQEKTNIQTSTLRVPKNILEEIKIYCRKAGKPVGEWVETAWKFIEKNDFDIYDKETTPFLPVPPDIEKERNQVEALCMLMSEFITAQKQIQLPAPELIHTAALFRCSTGKQQILGYGSFSCINVSKNS
jgi:hypothetical protein